MLNTASFGKRLQLLMDYYGLSASAFADRLAVGRSSISHILSGRNKPSLEFVLKIVDVFSEVDLEWLLYGKGTFPKSKKTTLTEKPTPSSNLFEQATDQKKIPSPSSLQKNISSVTPIANTETKIVEEPKAYNSTIEKQILKGSSDKIVEKIIILYTDGTFDSYNKS